MKNSFSGLLFAAVLISSSVYSLACMDNKKGEDTKAVAEEHNDAKFDETNNEKDAQFIVEAAQFSRKEMSLGELAEVKGNTKHVVELGKMLKKDHTKSLAEITVLAKTKNISIPTAQTDDGLDAYKKLNDKTGYDFGKEYSNMMVDDQKSAVDKFEKAAAEANDPEVRQWASQMLPTIRNHVDQSIACQKECSKNK